MGIVKGLLMQNEDRGFSLNPGKMACSEYFKDANNHSRVPHGYKVASGFALGRWISRQRREYKKDQLTPERIQRLDELRFVWKLKK